jgi:hypothetical protein
MRLSRGRCTYQMRTSSSFIEDSGRASLVGVEGESDPSRPSTRSAFAASIGARAGVEPQVVDIWVNRGYQPAQTVATADAPLRLVFHRHDADLCTERVVFSSPRIGRPAWPAAGHHPVYLRHGPLSRRDRTRQTSGDTGPARLAAPLARGERGSDSSARRYRDAPGRGGGWRWRPHRGRDSSRVGRVEIRQDPSLQPVLSGIPMPFSIDIDPVITSFDGLAIS